MNNNKSDMVSLTQRRQQQQQQQRTSSDEVLQLEEDVQLAREAIVWLVRRVHSLPMPRSFLSLALSLLSAMQSPSVYYILMCQWQFKERYDQSVIAEALSYVSEEQFEAYAEAVVRGNKEVWRCSDILLLIPDAYGLRSKKGAVIIRDALKRECDRTFIAQEEEWEQGKLERAMYREYLKDKEAALAAMPTASVVSAGAIRSRSHSPKRARGGRKASPRRSRSLSRRRQAVNKVDELPQPTLLEGGGYDHIFIAEPPESITTPLSTRRSSQEAIAEQAISEDSCSRGEGDTPGVKFSPPLSCSTEETSPTPPLTPPLVMSPSASSNESLSVEPPLLDLLPATPPTPPAPATPPPRPPPRTSSTNSTGGMFYPELDKPGVLCVVKDVLCSERVMNDRPKAARVLKELEDDCIRAETMEWIIRGLRSARGKRELAQRHDGLEFVGPRWGAPMYKTGNGVGRLLRGVAGKHEAGSKFVVCASSNSGGNGADNVRIITGVLSGPSQPSQTPTLDTAQQEQVQPVIDTAQQEQVRPVIDGEVPGLSDWVNACGNLDDGCRLWAWIY